MSGSVGLNNHVAKAVHVGWLVAVLTWLPNAISQDSKHPTYTVQSQLVQIFVTVSNGRQKITSLRASDFSITEDGRTKELYRLDSAEVPLQVTLLLDTSSSMREALPVIQDAAVFFVDSLHRGDRVTLIPFNSEIQSFPQLLDDLEPIRQAIQSTRASGATRLYDALLFAMKYLADKEGRKAIVVFSDGEDTGRSSSLNLVLNAAARYGYPIYAIGAGAALDRDSLKLVLRQLAEINSGRHYYVEDPSELRDTFGKVAEELRSAYVLNYYTQVPQDGRWHDIEIGLPNPRYKIHSRRGFYARAGGSKEEVADLNDAAPPRADTPVEGIAGDPLQAEKAARAAAAEILSAPVSGRPIEPEKIRATLPQPQEVGPTDPVFRVETRLIEVPVLLESATKREIPPLSAKDFRIYEDEVPRDIAFFNEGLTSENMAQVRKEARQDVEARNPTRPLIASPADRSDGVLGKLFLLLDDLLTSASSFLDVKKAAETVIRESHLPLRPVSIHFVSESEAEGTVIADLDLLLARLKRGISRPNRELSASGNVMSVYEAYLIDRGDREATLLAELRLASSLQVAYENDLGRVEGPIIVSPEEIQTEVTNRSRALVVVNESQVDRFLDGLQATIGAASADSNDYPKTVILISSGFVMGHGALKPRLRNTIDSARRQGIKVFTIDAAGLAPREGIGIDVSNVFLVQNPGLDRILRAHESSWIFERESSLAQLAGDTGGRFFHGTNDLAAAAATIVRTTGRLYYIGYLSDQPSDGRFHQIRVAASAPGVRVHARRGYFAEPGDGEVPDKQFDLDPEDWQSLLAKAEESRAAGDSTGLIASLERLVRIFPRSVDLRYNLGAAHLEAGNHGEAVRAFQKALIMAPEDIGIAGALARAFMAAGSPGAAVETIVLMIQRHPTDLQLRLQLGRLFEAAGRSGEAYQVYRQVLDCGFDIPLELYLALTRTSLVLGRKVEAGIFSRDYLGRGGSAEALQPWLRR